MVILSVLNHVVLGGFIWKKKRKLNKIQPQQKQPKVFVISLGRQCQGGETNSGTKSGDILLVDCMISLLFSVLMVFLPASLLVLPTILLGMPMVLTHTSLFLLLFLSAPLAIYCRKPCLRATLVRELKDAF